MKKLISVMLACVMAMALMIPAFATSQTLTGTGVTAAPTIKLTMPKAANIALNPYRMSYKNEKIGINTAQTGTFISPVVSIKNESNVALDMSIKGNATKAGEIKIISDATAVVTSDPGDKNVQISINVLADQANEAAAGTLTIGTGKKTAVMTDKAADLFGGASTDSPAISLASCAGADGTTITPTYTYINFSGSCNTNPKNAYTSTDTVGASLTFTFTPVAAAAAAG